MLNARRESRLWSLPPSARDGGIWLVVGMASRSADRTPCRRSHQRLTGCLAAGVQQIAVGLKLPFLSVQGSDAVMVVALPGS